MHKELKVLIVYGGNKGDVPPFIKEQVDSLKELNIITEYFLIKGKGIMGYLKNIPKYYSVIKRFNPNIIHAHYGLSGLFANFQRKIPVITTYHGSDVNLKFVRLFSKISAFLSLYNIFVSEDLKSKIRVNISLVIPCGVDTNLFYYIDKVEARKKLNLSPDKKYVLFSSSFDNPLKNYKLAELVMQNVSIKSELLEFKGYNRSQAALLFNAVDVALMTSLSEGSPQFIKEALACNCPIVSRDVGDVKLLLENVENTYISNNPKDIAEKIDLILSKNCRSNGRKKIIDNYEIKIIANRIKKIYLQCLK